MIEVRDLTYSYPGTAAPALRAVNLSIPRGQVVGIVGANGAGKSTLCYALTGYVPHFFAGSMSGTVRVDGRDIGKVPLGQLAAEIGLVFHNPFNQISGARLTVLEEVAFGLENMGVERGAMLPRALTALQATGLEHLTERSPYSLSGGEQQRLAIAAILAMEPSVMVMDEPTSQLDPVGTREVLAVLRDLARSRRATVVVAEHKLGWLAAFSDRLIGIHNGEIVADGTPQEVFSSERIDEWRLGQPLVTKVGRAVEVAEGRPRTGLLPVTVEQALDALS
ncbi:MAG TPA: ABC transporter ATP-binding protein [Anaerolineales bacterium]|nr:ABC transporter ATP-binding protein [Anaerolineales bacterium]